jgi:membrane protease YdiL (CAAX protease family)
VSTAPPPLAPVPAGGDPSAARPPWPPWSAAAALITAIAGTLLVSIVVAVPALGSGAKSGNLPHWVGIVSSYGGDAVFIACALGFARLRGRLQAAQLGFRAPASLGGALGLMAAAGLAVFVFGLVWQDLVHLSQQEDLTKKLGIDDGTGALVAIAALVCVAAPIAEETFFRGFFFGALRNWRGVWPAAAITGVVFGAVHVGSYSVAYLPPLAVLGFALCLLRWRTGSLYPCIALHAMNNGLAFGVLRHWTWWQVIATMLGALLAVGLILAVARISRRSVAASRTLSA